jgi:hypothetical protein
MAPPGARPCPPSLRCISAAPSARESRPRAGRVCDKLGRRFALPPAPAILLSCLRSRLAPHSPSRASSWRTVPPIHSPMPRGVWIPRALRAAAMPRSDVTPVVRSSAMTGARSAARALARALIALQPNADRPAQKFFEEELCQYRCPRRQSWLANQMGRTKWKEHESSE